MSTYVPELGQMAFGQPFGPHACPPILEAALRYIDERLRHLIEAALPYEEREGWTSPFGNYSNTFSCPVFDVVAYEWDEDVTQEWNFRCGDVHVSWYKTAGRGMTCAVAYTPDQVSAMLERCLAYIERAENLIDDDYGTTLTEEGKSVLEALRNNSGRYVQVPDVPSLREEPRNPVQGPNPNEAVAKPVHAVERIAALEACMRGIVRVTEDKSIDVAEAIETVKATAEAALVRPKAQSAKA